MNVSARNAALSSASNNERHLPPIPSQWWRSIPEVTSALKRMIPFRLHNKECGVLFHDTGLQLDRKTLRRLSVHDSNWNWRFLFLFLQEKHMQFCNSAVLLLIVWNWTKNEFVLKRFLNLYLNFFPILLYLIYSIYIFLHKIN